MNGGCPGLVVALDSDGHKEHYAGAMAPASRAAASAGGQLWQGIHQLFLRLRASRLNPTVLRRL
jgi:hypothetical protein